MDSYKPLLDRAIRKEIDPLITKTASVMDRVIDYGTHLLIECDKKGRFPSITPVLLGRQIIELLDAISILVRRSCVEPAKILLRSQMEGSFALLYIVQEDSVRRARCYEVAVRHARISLHQRFDHTTDTGKQFRNEWMKDDVCKDIPFTAYESEPHVQILLDGLKKPEYAEVEAEWQRVKQAKKQARKSGTGGTPTLEWFSLFGGPKKIQDLARAVGMGGYYESIYRMFSTYAHAEDVHTVTRTLKETDIGVLLPLRYPKELVTVANFAISMALQTYRALIQLYLDDDALKGYATWYRSEVSRDFMEIANSEIVDPQLK